MSEKVKRGQAVVVHTFNLSTRRAEAGSQYSVSLRPAWSTEHVPGQVLKLQRNHVLKKLTIYLKLKAYRTWVSVYIDTLIM